MRRHLLVQGITDDLARILADVSDRQPDEVAVARSQTDELDGADPADLGRSPAGPPHLRVTHARTRGTCSAGSVPDKRGG